MAEWAGARPRPCSRRAFLAAALAAAGAGRAAAAGGRRRREEDRDRLPAFERLHLPALQLPVLTANGAKVPLVVALEHPMEEGHAITVVRVVNERDPVPSKGTFHFTPANGQAYLALQVRLDQGVSEVVATASCNRHGDWSTVGSVAVPDGAGGCAAPAPPPGPGGEPAIRPPALRIPELAKRGRVRPGEVVDVQLTMRHPSRTGLGVQGGRWVQVSEPFYLTELEVFYGEARVSRFLLTPALSDDPLITFRLRATREAPVRAVLTNSRGARFEARHPVRLS